MFAILVGDNVIGNSFNVSLKMCAVHLFWAVYISGNGVYFCILRYEKVTYEKVKFKKNR